MLADLGAESSFPSWCPDLTQGRRTSSFPSNFEYQALGMLHTCSAKLSKDLQSLYVDGFSVDTVAEIKPKETESMLRDLDQKQDWSQNIDNMARVLNISEKVRHYNREAGADLKALSQEPIETVLCDISEIINGTQAGTRSTVTSGVAQPEGLTVSSDERSQIHTARSAEDDQLFFDVRYFLENRLIMISNTRYFGFAPGATRPGDHIFLLFGFSFPVILRPKLEGSWTFVGRAFIVGLMRGEAMVEYKRGIYKKQRLELR